MKRMFAILLAFLVLVQSTWALAADFSDGTGDDTFSSGSEDMITELSEEEIFSEPDMSSEDETSEDNFSTSDEEENETQSAQNDQEQEITAESLHTGSFFTVYFSSSSVVVNTLKPLFLRTLSVTVISSECRITTGMRSFLWKEV